MSVVELSVGSGLSGSRKVERGFFSRKNPPRTASLELEHQSKLSGMTTSAKLTSASNPTHGLWDIAPPHKVVEVHNLEAGQVNNFFDDKGYGFMDTADGRLFFHASGFRVPRPVLNKVKGVTQQEIQLAPVRPREKADGKDKNEVREKAGKIPIPQIAAELGLLFTAGERNGKRQALVWCLQDMYVALKNQLTSRYEEEYQAWERLGRYKLELCEVRVIGQPRADNRLKAFVQDTNVFRTELFQGTNVEYLKDWFRGCRDAYKVSSGNQPDTTKPGHQWLELQFCVYDEATRQHGEWQKCDAEIMHDFLGT